MTTRRTVLRAAGLGLAGLAGAGGGGAVVRYRDVTAARERNDGATVALHSDATSLRVLWRARTDEKVMAFTFDDGPGDELTAGLLEVLREEKVRATFCLVGERARELPGLVRTQVREGHELANHSWSHADLGLLDYAAVKDELERTDDVLADLAGGRRPAVIRPPYGRVSGALLQHAAQTGQDVLLWDVRFRESELDTAGNTAHVLEHLRPGTVLLGHDAGRSDRKIGVEAVPGIIKEAKARGYRFLTASEMFDLDARS